MPPVKKQIDKAPTILRRKQVEARTGLGKSMLYLKISQKEFPAPVRLGPRAVGWLESAVEQWIQTREVSGTKGAA